MYLIDDKMMLLTYQDSNTIVAFKIDTATSVVNEVIKNGETLKINKTQATFPTYSYVLATYAQ